MIKIKINVISDKNSALLGELIKFTIEIYNDEQNKLKNVEFSIIPCIGTLIIPMSILINDKPINNSSYDKIFLGDINPNEKIVVTYIEKIEALTIENKIVFRGKFKYLSDKKIKEQNLILKTVKINILKLKIDNYLDINEGALNEKIKLEFNIKNTGNLQLLSMELEEFWNRYSDILKLDKVYINDTILNYNNNNKIICKKFDVNESLNIKIIFKAKKVPDKLLTMIPKIKVRYTKEELLYEEKIIEGSVMYINIHSTLLKEFEKTFIINRNTDMLDNTFYKIKVKDTRIDKVVVKKQGIDIERNILKVILNVIFKSDTYKNYDNELLEFKILLPKKYEIKKDQIYVGIMKDVLKIHDDKTLLLKFNCNIYNNNFC